MKAAVTGSLALLAMGSYVVTMQEWTVRDASAKNMPRLCAAELTVGHKQGSDAIIDHFVQAALQQASNLEFAEHLSFCQKVHVLHTQPAPHTAFQAAFPEASRVVTHLLNAWSYAQNVTYAHIQESKEDGSD